MSGPARITVTLRTGEQYTGQYIGAQDGWLYLRNGEHVEKLVQRMVLTYEECE